LQRLCEISQQLAIHCGDIAFYKKVVENWHRQYCQLMHV